MILAADPAGTAARYARELLTALGEDSALPRPPVAIHPALRWAESGLMSLTGAADGPPLMCPAPLASCADGALAAMAALAPELKLSDGAGLLAERAAIFGLSRQGAVAPGGSCRLLQAADGPLALNLPRADDWDAIEAWLEHPAADWSAIALVVAQRSAVVLVERAQELGLACGLDATPRPQAWWQITVQGQPSSHPKRAPRVLDMSGLWAGPLCGQLLQLAGAEVIKLESPSRPDGARRGPQKFFDLLNAGKQMLALDLGTQAGVQSLRELIASVDIVIEASRPRAMAQLGLSAETLVAQQPGLTWLSLSGYGRDLESSRRIAFGDDAGVAAGLSSLMRESCDAGVFVGDAIADPMTGLHAALAAWSSFRQGGGRLLSVAMVDVLAHALHFELPATSAARRERWAAWQQLALAHVAPPRLSRSAATAAALGADSETVLKALAC